MDERMLGESSRGARLWESEHMQHAREETSEAIPEGALKIKEEEFMHVAVGDSNPISEVLPTPRKWNWTQYIPSRGTPTQVPTTTTYTPQT